MNAFNRYPNHAELFAAAAAKARAKAEHSNRIQYKPDFRLPKLRSVQSERIGYGPLVVSARANGDVEKLREEMQWHAPNDRNFTIVKGDPHEDHYITLRQMKRSYGAVAFLNCHDLMFNVFYTCTWASIYIDSDPDGHNAIKRHFNHLYHWADYRHIPLHYQWVVERGKNRGLHTHALVSVPKELIPALEHEVEQSILTIAGMRARRPTPPNPFLTKGDDTKTVDFQINPNVDAQWRRWRYMMEGLNPGITVSVRGRGKWNAEPIGKYLGLKDHSYQGRYTKKRFGMSRTLGPEAMRKFAVKYGKPYSALLSAKEPSDLYGSQYLDWAQMNKHEVKLLRSLEPPTSEW